MGFSLLPDLIFQKLTDLTPELLAQRNIRLLMMDFDNTIVPYTTDLPTEQMADWLKKMNQSAVEICVVSNSHNDRVKKFCRDYGLCCIVRAGKPGTRGILECLDRYRMTPEEAALVGDQIFTDTLGGNLAGVTTILVSAISNHNILLKARHVLELPFIASADRKGRRRS